MQAAIARGAGQAGHAGQAAPAAAQPHAALPARPLAPHVKAALGRTAPPPAAPRQMPAAQRQSAANPAIPGRDASGFVTYTDQKTPTTPPPPPRRPIYSLHCSDGAGCRIQDVRTGRWHEAGSMYAGFVRMQSGGTVYVSPRADPKVLGDSHPTIAAGTPEGQAGRRALVAAGEVGIVDNRIIGHNDKTGHYRTRKNYWQSGMPPELFHPFTEDPGNWYKTGHRPGERRQTAAETEPPVPI
ncbi:MAG TPA: hypothetical protein VFE33_21080 [Thermoanaerobaculia bacterium]|nr:hypothetical protein [Thermoanaerobaculia bacterium]